MNILEQAEAIAESAVANLASGYINPKAMTWAQKYHRGYQRRPPHWGPLCWNYCQPGGQIPPTGSHPHFTRDRYRDSQCEHWECRCPCHRPEARPMTWNEALGR